MLNGPAVQRVEQTRDVKRRIRGSILDEPPWACKDVETVVVKPGDLSEAEQCLEQMVCVKG